MTTTDFICGLGFGLFGVIGYIVACFVSDHVHERREQRRTDLALLKMHFDSIDADEEEEIERAITEDFLRREEQAK